jgi:hypothetical protein
MKQQIKEKEIKNKNKVKAKNKKEIIERKIETQNELIIEENILFYTSFFFITNIITAFYKKYYLYSFIFFMLTLTSIIHHSHYTIYTNIIDKISIFFVVTYGAYILYTKKHIDNFMLTLIVITFVSTIILYIIGYFTKHGCFHPNKCVSENYHCLLHFISSFGHQLIILL